MKTIGGSLDAFGEFIETLRFRKDHVRERLIRRDTLQIAGTKTFDQLPVISAPGKRTATDNRELFAACQFDWFREAIQTSMALIFARTAGRAGVGMGHAAAR